MSYTFYRVRVSHTAKTVGSSESFRLFDKQDHNFDSLEQAKAYVRETYGGRSRVKMYRDIPDTNQGEHCGWVYRMGIVKEYNDEHSYYQQDWVEIQKLEVTGGIV